MRFRLRTLLTQFTIRDILWLTVIVAVALTLWLRWSRETVVMQEESAAREEKLRDQIAAERDLGKTKMKGLQKAHRELMIEAMILKAKEKDTRERYSDTNSEIIRLQDEVRQLKAEAAGRSQAATL